MTDKTIEALAERALERVAGGVIESLGVKYTALKDDRSGPGRGGSAPGAATGAGYIGETEKNLG